MHLSTVLDTKVQSIQGETVLGTDCQFHGRVVDFGSKGKSSRVSRFGVAADLNPIAEGRLGTQAGGSCGTGSGSGCRSSVDLLAFPSININNHLTLSWQRLNLF